MRFEFLAVLPVANALSLSAYDLGFNGIFPTQSYKSSTFKSPEVKVTQWDDRCENGDYILLAPRGSVVKEPGPVILDPRGNLVWTETKFGGTTNFQVQKFKGKDYLTFWAGLSEVGGAHSQGTYYLLDDSYELAYGVSAVGLRGDQHEFRITNDDTVLITVYQDIELDCTSLGFDSTCWINDCLFQELDIETGALLFEWRASDHIPYADSYKTIGKEGHTEKTSWDFFHMNSVDKDADGNYIISARYTHGVHCISPTGEVIWTLGGKNSSFKDLSDGRASDFKWQHHASMHANNTLSIFDNNGNNVFHSRSDYSRGLLVSLNMAKMTATLQQEFVHPDSILAISQGSMQLLPNGGAFVGWGNSPAYTEFAPNGDVMCDVSFGAKLFFEILDVGLVKSYRTFKYGWVGHPKNPPDVAIDGDELFVSWNGATEVASWKLQASTSEKGDWEDVDHIEKEAFESAFDLLDEGFYRVAALDKQGAVLGTSAAVKYVYTGLGFLGFLLLTCAATAAGLCVWIYWVALCGVWRSLRRSVVERRTWLPLRQKVQLYDLIQRDEEGGEGDEDRDGLLDGVDGIERGENERERERERNRRRD